MNDRMHAKRDELAEADLLYQERCTRANSALYAAVKVAKTSDEIEAAYAMHIEARNAALKAYTDSRRSILGH